MKMIKKNRDKIIDEHPNLYRKCKFWECEDGWNDIIDKLSDQLENLINKLNPEFREEIYAEQIKEKYGTLRFYMSNSTDDMDKFIDKAEALSSETCEVCGNPGKTRGNRWIQTLCDDHNT
jgi:hypothetical protein